MGSENEALENWLKNSSYFDKYTLTSKYLHVTFSPEYLKSKTEATSAVEAWESVFDWTYDESDDEFTCWMSSFTGEQIPRNEMLQWVSSIVDSISSYKPKHLLEIGVGLGILLKEIIPRGYVKLYRATDISLSSVNHIQRFVDNVGWKKNVVVDQREATNFEGMIPGTYDMVILNSVAQYFPSLEYFENVLNGAVQLLRPGGRFFIGDIRNYDLLSSFHTAVQKNITPNVSDAELDELVQMRIGKDFELLISPAFFCEYVSKNLDFSLMIELHRGKSRNEMNSFRYNAILVKNGGQLSTFVKNVIQWDNMTNFENTLQLKDYSSAVVVGIPNYRVYQVKQHLHQVDPEKLAKFGESLGYEVRLIPSKTGKSECFDLLLSKQRIQDYVYEAKWNRENLQLSSAPLTAQAVRKAKTALQKKLEVFIKEESGFSIPKIIYSLPPIQIVGLAFAMEIKCSESFNWNLLEKTSEVWNKKILNLFSQDVDTGHLVGRNCNGSTQQISLTDEPVIQFLKSNSKKSATENIIITDESDYLKAFFQAYTALIADKTELVFILISRNFEIKSDEANFMGVLLQRCGTSIGPSYGTIKFLSPMINDSSSSLLILRDSPPKLLYFEENDIKYFWMRMLSLKKERIKSQKKTDKTIYTNEALNKKYQGNYDNELNYHQNGHLQQNGNPEQNDYHNQNGHSMAGQNSNNDWLSMNESMNEDKHIQTSYWQKTFLASPNCSITWTWAIQQVYNLDLMAVAWEIALSQFPNFQTEIDTKSITPALVLNDEFENLNFHSGDKCCSSNFDLKTGSLYEIVYGEREGTFKMHPAIFPAQEFPKLLQHVNEVYKSLTLDSPVLPRFTLKLKGEKDLKMFNGDKCHLNGIRKSNPITLVSPLSSSSKVVLQVQWNINLDFESTVLYIWHRLLTAYGHTGVTVIGTPIGLCAYTHPAPPESQLSAQEAIERLQKEMSSSFNIRYMCDTEATDVFLNFYNVTEIDDLKMSQSRYFPHTYPIEIEHFTLANEPEENIEIRVWFNPALFEASNIQLIMEIFQGMLENVKFNPNVPVSYLSLEAHNKVINTWNDTSVILDERNSIHELFEAQVDRTPEARALISEDSSFSYKELNAHANRLAHHLQELGVQRGNPVVLHLERTEWMIVGILGVLKAGGAYVPIDPTYPLERKLFILEDSGSKFLVTMTAFLLPSMVTLVDVKDGKAENVSNLGLKVTGSDLAYVMYTSGSTGRPKGTLLEHRGIINNILWMNSNFPLAVGEPYMLKTPYVFDVSVAEIVSPLFAGACQVIVKPDAHTDLSYLVDLIENEGVTKIHFVPSMLSLFVSHVELYDESYRVHTLTHIFLIGEALPLVLVQKVRKLWPWVGIHNLYGPTEASIDVLYYDCTIPFLEKVYIGKPIANTQVYVLDAYFNPLPFYAPGEIFIGGFGLARGYLNQAQLTASKFLPNPFHPGGRIYASGDLGTWTPSGVVDYLGRIDRQVKLRGFRIELDEIRSLVASYEEVVEAAVVIKQGPTGEDYLMAYFTSKSKIEAGKIRKWLARHLPEYMLPHVIIPLQSFPLTSNGKLDEKSLPFFTESFIPKCNLQIKKPMECPNSPAMGTLGNNVVNMIEKCLGLQSNFLSLEDNFLNLGGNSVQAISIISLLRQAGIVLTLPDFFGSSDLRDLIERVHQISPEEEDVQQDSPLEKLYLQQKRHNVADIEGVYLANSLQQGFIFHNLKSQEKGREYIVQNIWDYESELRVEVLKEAWEVQQQKYATLRLNFDFDIETVQIVRNSMYLDWRYEEFDKSNKEKTLNNILASDLSEGFNLRHGPLYHIRLLKWSQKSYTCIFTYHHTILDGWSTEILLEQVHSTYLQFLSGQFQQDAKNNTYHASQKYIERNHRTHLTWWQEYCSKITQKNELVGLVEQKRYFREGSFVEIIPTEQKQVTLEHAVKGQIWTSLEQWSKVHKVTLNAIFLFIWHKALCLFGNSTVTVTGVVVSGRNIPVAGIHVSVGCHINTLPTIVSHDSDPSTSLLSLIQRLQQDVQELNSRSTVNLGDLASKVDGQIFDTIFVYENYPSFCQSVALEGLGIRNYNIVESQEYTLGVLVTESREQVLLKVTFDTTVYCQSRVARFISSIDTMIKILTEVSNPLLTDLAYMESADYEKIRLYNGCDKLLLPSEELFDEIFENVADRNAKNIAYITENGELSYSEIDCWANILSLQLYSDGLKHEEIVPIFLKQLNYLPEAIFGVLRAGGAYVLIDPNMPDSRTGEILRQVEPRFILTTSEQQPQLEHILTNVIEISPKLIKMGENLETSDSRLKISGRKGSDLACVIYTSGSTGVPKGVLLEHKNLVNFCHGFGSRFSGDVSLCLFGWAFDGHLGGLVGGLLTAGVTVFPKPNDVFDPERILKFANQIHVTQIQGNPLLLEQLDLSKVEKLHTLIFAGDVLREEFVARCHQTLSNVRLINGYGPTEAAVGTLLEDPVQCSSVTIGRPLSNTLVYILDSVGLPVPVGCVGEIYIGGLGVSRGYLNSPEQTAQSFVPNPFGPGRLFKSGDLARWNDDGRVEYIGRQDFQVKVQGYRVELSEITTRINFYPGIVRSVVIANKFNGRNVLTAYFVPKESYMVSESDLFIYLSQHLPHYMVPSNLCAVDYLPLTSNGKLDVESLKLHKSISIRDNYKPPRDSFEKSLCQIWQECLGISLVGISDNFFRLGGDSISSIRIVGKCRELLDSCVQLTVGDIFTYLTIEHIGERCKIGKVTELSEEEQRNKSEKAEKIVNEETLCNILVIGDVEGIYRANSLQQGFIYHALTNEGVEGLSILQHSWRYEQEISLDILKLAWEAAVLNFPALRLRFNWEVEVVQIISKSIILDWRITPDGTNLEEIQHRDQAERYDLQKGPLFRLYFVNNDNTWTFLLSCHHTILEGWSCKVLMDFVHRSYLLASQGKPIIVSNDTAYTLAQEYLQSVESAHQDFWNNYLKEADPSRRAGLQRLKLSKHRITDKCFGHDSGAFTVQLSAHLCLELKKLCQNENLTLNSLFQFAWHQVLLHTGSGDGKVTVTGLTMSMRNIPVYAVDGSVGLYINTLPLVVDHSQKNNILEALHHLQENINQVVLHSHVSLGSVVAGRGTLFETLCFFDNTPWIEDVVKLSPVTGYNSRGYPVELLISPDENEYIFELSYDPRTFDPKAIERALLSMTRILETVVQQPDSSVLIIQDSLLLATSEQDDFTLLEEISCLDKYLPQSGKDTKNEEVIRQAFSEVLGFPCSEIPANDTFFELGGNSLLAIRLASKLSKSLGRSIPLAALIKNFSVKNVVEFVGEGMKDQLNPIPIVPGTHFPLSFAQERFWFLEQYQDGKSSAFNVPTLLEIGTDVNIQRLKWCLVQILQRHEVLRSCVKPPKDDLKFFQTVLPAELIVEEVNVDNSESLENELESLSGWKFDLAVDIPVKVTVITYKCSNQISVTQYLSIVVHHIAFDGWSVDLLLQELSTLYESNTSLPLLPIQYKEYAAWEKLQDFSSSLAYWKTELRGLESLNFPLDFCRPTDFDYSGDHVWFEVDVSLADNLRSLARRLKATLFTVLFAGFALTVRSFSAQNEFGIGTPVTNRDRSELQGLIGLFINTIVLRVNMEGSMTIHDLVCQLFQKTTEGLKHKDMQFDRLLEFLSLPKDPSRHPIFQIMFSVDDFGVKGAKSHDGILKLRNQKVVYSISQFDLFGAFEDHGLGQKLVGCLTYATSLFERRTIVNFMETYKRILLQMTPHTKIGEISYAEKVERPNSYPLILRTINETFENVVNEFPEKVAVISGKVIFTYARLNAFANGLCKRLDIQPDTLVPLISDKCELVVGGIIGILKAGGAYVPIDPDFPLERIKFILEDVGAEVVVGMAKYKELVKIAAKKPVKFVDLDTVVSLLENPSPKSTGNNLAYGIYTSGTTGQPKCCLVNHAPFLNLIPALTNLYLVTGEKEVLTQVYSIAFDASIEQMFLATLNGYTCLLVTKETLLEPEEFYAYLKHYGATHIDATPTLINQYDLRNIPTLRRVILSGEGVSLDTMTKYRTKSLPVWNSYGLTEVTVTSAASESNCLGKPIANTSFHIVTDTQWFNEVPIGGVGELLIGGECLARGYLNRPQLTVSKFLRNPFQTQEEMKLGVNQRLYLTGDLFRREFNGALSYIGRRDGQIKIRGHRVECNGIATVLNSYPSVDAAAVVPFERESQNLMLVAYYVAPEVIADSSLRSFMELKLPFYSIPSVFVQVAKLPMTISSKLDVASLPQPTFAGSQDTGRKVLPRTELENKMVQIWAEVLGLSAGDVGITDNFFSLGGDSLVSTQVVSRFRNRLGFEVTIKDIFRCLTIERLHDLLSPQLMSSRLADGPLSNMQECFIEINPNIQNLNYALYWETPLLDIEILRTSVKILVCKHDSLKMLFKFNPHGQGSRWTPNQNTSNHFVLNPTVSIKNLVNIETSPSFLVCYTQGTTSSKIGIGTNELLIDRKSSMILMKELFHLYTGKHSKLPFVMSKNFSSSTCSLKHSFSIDCNVLKAIGEGYQTTPPQALVVSLLHSLNELIPSAYHSLLVQLDGRTEHKNFEIGSWQNLFPLQISAQSEILSSLVSIKETLASVTSFAYRKNDSLNPIILPRVSFQYEEFDNIENWVYNPEGIQFNFQFATIACWAYSFNSKTCVQVATKISEEFSTQLSTGIHKHLLSLLESITKMNRSYLTLSDISANINISYLQKLQEVTELEGIFPATTLQIGFVHHALGRESQDTSNLSQMVLEYHSPDLDLERLRLAWVSAMKKHPALRTRFAWEEGIVQIIDKYVALDWRVYNSVRTNDIQRVLDEDQLEYFDLGVSPLFRIKILRHIRFVTCILSYHHILLDGWSLAPLLTTVHTHYNNNDMIINADTAFIVAQTYIAPKPVSKYWESYLGRVKNPVKLWQGSYKFTLKPDVASLTLKPFCYQKLRQISSTMSVGLNAIVLFALHQSLYAYGEGEETVVGMAFSGRDIPVPHIDSSVGLFISTLPIVVSHRERIGTLLESIRLIQENILEHQNNQNCNLVELCKASGRRLFEILYLYDRLAEISSTVDKELGIVYKETLGKVDFPMNFVVNDQSNAMTLSLMYDPRLVTSELVSGIFKTLECILNQVANAPNTSLNDLKFLQNGTTPKKWNFMKPMQSFDQAVVQTKVKVTGRNETEFRMLGIWAESLGINQDSFGIDDDFFALGGNSLISIQTVSKLSFVLRCKFSIGDLYKHKTIRQLYTAVYANSSDKVIAKQNPVVEKKKVKTFQPTQSTAKKYLMKDFSTFEPYVEVNDTGAQTVYLFPPAFGGAECYMGTLVPHIPQLRLIVFNNFMLEIEKITGEIGSVRYEDLADEYIKIIRRIDHVGPYHFFGFCFGGVLAFEIARQLTMSEMGKVRSLVLVDPFFGYRDSLVPMGNDPNDLSNIYIDYYYNPFISPFLRGTTFVLFKPVVPWVVPEGEDISKVEREAVNRHHSYYVDSMEYNGLENCLPWGTELKVEKLFENDHVNWIQDPIAQSSIAKSIIASINLIH